MNTKTRQFGWAIGFLVIVCVGASAETVYVDGGYDGGEGPPNGTKERPWKTIQDAVDDLPGGRPPDGEHHEIRIKDQGSGTDYEECVEVNGKWIWFRSSDFEEEEELDERTIKISCPDPEEREEDGPGAAGNPGLHVTGGGNVFLTKVKFTGGKGQDGRGTDDEGNGHPGGPGGPGIKAEGEGTRVDKHDSCPSGGDGGKGARNEGRGRGGNGGDGAAGEVADGARIDNLNLSSAVGGAGGAGGDSADGEGGAGGDGGAGARAENGGEVGSSDSSRPQGGQGGRGGSGGSSDGPDGDTGQDREGDDENFYYVADTHFVDDFEGHDIGPICTGGAWEEWEGSEDVCGSVTDEHAHRGFQSLRIDGVTGTQGDDVVQRFGSIGGVWDFSARIFVPARATGQGFVILLNQYPAQESHNWSLQLLIDADELIMFNYNEPDQITSIIPDHWGELTARIDLDNDNVEVTYEGHTFVSDRSWRDGVAPGGQPWIQAIDLYAGEPGSNGISELFFDDVSLIEFHEVFGACCVDEEGFCADEILEAECADWQGRFAADRGCADLDPPCGETGGCTREPQWGCDGDVDGDGQVNPVDAGLVQSAFGSTDEQDLCNYDVDCDGQINPVDAGIVQSLFGTCDAPRAACP